MFNKNKQLDFYLVLNYFWEQGYITKNSKIGKRISGELPSCDIILNRLESGISPDLIEALLWVCL